MEKRDSAEISPAIPLAMAIPELQTSVHMQPTIKSSTLEGFTVTEAAIDIIRK